MPTGQPAAPAAARQATVDRARAEWVRRLVDYSRRNNLLFFRELQTGTLDLTGATPEAMADLLSPEWEEVPLRSLVTADALEQSIGRVREIARRGIVNLEEKGLETQYLAIGMATWTPSDGGRPPDAPMLLLPVSIQSKGRDGRQISLRRTGDVQANLALLHFLADQHGIDVGEEALVSAVQGDDDGEEFDCEPAFSLLEEECAAVAGFAVKRQYALGNFSFQKLAMVRDIRDQSLLFTDNQIIAALAGDAGAREGLRSGPSVGEPQELDALPPADEFLVLDADSTQQRAVRRYWVAATVSSAARQGLERARQLPISSRNSRLGVSALCSSPRSGLPWMPS